jgi:Protein of unknown function (DUF3108)
MRSVVRLVILLLALKTAWAAPSLFQESTADPKAATLAKVDPASIRAPIPEKDPTPGIYKYNATVAANGQQMTIELETEVKDDGVNLVFVDTMKTPMGEATDTATVSRGSLLIRSRLVNRGSLVVDAKYDGSNVTGKITRNGTDKPIEANLGGPAFAEAAGAPFVIGSLPLKEGYTTAFRNFDLQKQKVKIEQLAVAGSESVTVPAGTFDCYKVDVNNPDDPAERVTYWVAKTSRTVVKIEAKVPSMGGATMKAELQ